MMATNTPPVSYRFTRHARVRQQQRGIGQCAVEAALDHGRVIELGNGVRAYFLGRRDLCQLARIAPKLARSLWRFCRTTVLVSNETGRLVTTYKCHRAGSPRRANR